MPMRFRRFSIIPAMTAAVLIVGSGAALQVATAQQNGVTRTDLQRHDLSAPGREAIQVRVDFSPGTVSPSSPFTS
jgi:hypothetical protein